MRKHPLLASVLGVFTLFCTSQTPLHAAVTNRVTQAVKDNARVALPESIHPKAKAAADLGEAPADQPLSTVTLQFGLSAAQEAALDQLLIDQQNPASPRYHQWLTPEQFGAQFGLSAGDLTKITSWLTSKGLTVTGTARAGNFVTVSGTVAQIEQAFSTRLHAVSFNGERHFANLTEPTLPSAFAGVVTGITGLNDFKLKPRATVRKVNPAFTSSVSGSHFIAPGDFYTIYDVNPLLSSSINGTGVSIAVVGQTNISLADVAAFRSASGLSANVPTVKLSGANPGTSSSDIDEAQLDVEWSGAVAPSASILYYNSNDVIDISLRNAVNDNLAPIITVSYGDCEINWGSTLLNTFNQLFKQANAQGQTVVSAAGDSGATDCDYQATSASGGLAVDFPASSPYVTGLGGTQYNEGNGAYWSATNGTNSGSATSYIPEAVWNETAADTAALIIATNSPTALATIASGGGGASAFFVKPAFQIGTGVPQDASRDVPDVSLNASASHDGYLFCSQGSCTVGFRSGSATGGLNVVGGTSVAAPTFAGLLALVEQKTGARLGNANPMIYGLANSTFYGNVFHDVVTGDNKSPCTVGTLNCLGGGSIGYSATAGYDQATGWGSVDAYNLVNDWALVSPAGGSATSAANLSTTTLATSVFNVVQGTNVTLTATVVSGSAGVTTTPTGTVQFLVDSAVVGTPVALTAGGATYALVTTSLAPGVHQVTAAYSGDSTYTGSKAAAQIDVTAATAADFTVTMPSSTMTVKSGGSTSQTVTVAGLHGFTGSVYFTASTTSQTLAATYYFSVSPVVLTGTTAGTSTFTLYAYQTNGTGGYTKLGPPTVAENRMPAWYAAGSGMTVAGLLMLVLPRRRKWNALLLAALSVGVMGASGCSGGTILSNGGSASTVSQTNATPGTYSITVTAYTTPTSGTPIAHDINVTFVVQ